jgi:pimeloyl-ACP methyl ester carboxylesterase
MSEVIVNNKKINYVSEGNGLNAVLVVHGWGGSEGLQGLYDLLKVNNKCIMLDLPGFGYSDNPDPSWGVGEYADLVVDFIKKLGLKKVVLFGHSFGGAVSIYISANYPNLVGKLILSAPSFKRENRSVHTNAKTFLGRVGGLTKSHIYKSLKSKLTNLRKVFYKIFYPKSEVLKYPHLEPNFRKIVTQDLSDLLPKIKQKTLILWGDKDTFVPLSHSFILKAKIKNSKLKVYNDIGHGLPKFKPEWVYMEIKKFIEED